MSIKIIIYNLFDSLIKKIDSTCCNTQTQWLGSTFLVMVTRVVFCMQPHYYEI